MRVTDTERIEERKLYRFAFLLRLVIGLSVWFLIMYARIPLLEDALHYEQMGAAVAADWLAGRESIWL